MCRGISESLMSEMMFVDVDCFTGRVVWVMAGGDVQQGDAN